MRYFCSQCKETISENVYKISKDRYGKPLCMKHQKASLHQQPQPRAYPKKRFFCFVCKEIVSDQVYDYSMKHSGTPLCMSHQKTVTPEAIKLSKALKNLEVQHTLEAYDGYKHVDIAIESAKLYIELDGSQHGFNSKQMLADYDRDKHSRKAGYDTIRIPNIWVNQNVYRLANSINKLSMKRQTEIKENENKITVTGIMKTMIKTAVKLSKKLEDFEI